MAHVNDTVISKTPVTDLVRAILRGEPVRVPMPVFYHERRRFLRLWHGVLPELPDDEIDATVSAVTQLATLRGGRS